MFNIQSRVLCPVIRQIVFITNRSNYTGIRVFSSIFENRLFRDNRITLLRCKLQQHKHSLNQQPLFEAEEKHGQIFYIPTRPITTRPVSLAKKSKKKDKMKSKETFVSITDEELDGVIDQQRMIRQMDDILEHLRQEYIQHLALRTNPDMFESLQVQTSDGRFPLNQLAQISMNSAQMMIINLSSTPQYIVNVKDALMKSGMNVNPQQEGLTLFVPIPKVTRERREELAKSAKTLCNTTKTKLRDASNTFVREARKSKADHSEDLIKKVEKLIHQRMHEHGSKAEELMQAKQNELLS